MIKKITRPQYPISYPRRARGGSLLSFKLKNPPPQLTNQLLLRFSPAVPKEGTIQQLLKTQNYPVPTIHHLCTDTSTMGRPFLIRDYLRGDVLWSEPSTEKKAQHMAENHAKLHKINPTPIIKALKETGVARV